MNAAEIAKVLIDNGAEVNAKSDRGDTPLHWAAEKNAAEIAKVLIANGAEVNAKSDHGDYAFALGGGRKRRRLRKC